MSSLQSVFKKIKTEKKNYIFSLKNQKKITYDELYFNAIKKFSFLSTYKQKKILVVVNNSIDYVEILIASVLSGNIFCPIPYFTFIREIEKTCDYLKPKFIISDKNLNLKNIYKSKLININCIKKSQKIFKSNLVKNKDLACIYYSSGTTSDPKGVMYSHANIFYLINSINKDFRFSRKTKHLVCLPFGHTASINYSIFPSLFLKSSFYIAENFLEISSNFFSIIDRYKITYVQIVPTIAIMLIKISENISKLNLKKIKFIGCGSSTLPKEIQEQFYKKFQINLANLYGLSETGPSHFDNPSLATWKSGYIGKPLTVNECKIATDGEILIKGKNVFVGYYNNKKLYNKVISKGWFKTGDLGIQISKKLFKFIDRKKDLIIKGGINIIPADVEEYIYHFKEVKEVAIVGIEDSVNGEEIYCCITVKNIKKESNLINKIDNYLKKKLSSFKVPKKIFIIDEMPLTKSGKIKRKDAKIIVKKKLTDDHDR